MYNKIIHNKYVIHIHMRVYKVFGSAGKPSVLQKRNNPKG